MSKWVAAALVTASLCSGPAVAATGKPLLATGVGQIACGAFNQIKDADPKAANDNFMSWAQGYMSGLNAGQARRADLNSIAPDETWKRLADYCTAHPKNTFVQGVMVLYRSLTTVP